MHELTFKTKDEYLTWRSLWRAEYRNLMIAIRTLKAGIITAQRSYQPWADQKIALDKHRSEATLMLSTRMRSKAIAGLQRDQKPVTDESINAVLLATIERQKARATRNMAKALAIKNAKRAAYNKTRKTTEPLSLEETVVLSSETVVKEIPNSGISEAAD